MAETLRPPVTEILKSIPGFFGIRLEAEPKYDVVGHRGDIEIRRYHPATVAEVTVTGEHDEAVDEAFRKLAAYIFGKNAGHDELAMTVPVVQRSERLPMTTPVVQKAQGKAWTLSFFLGNAMPIAEAPKPLDDAIVLREEPERLVAALRYRGNNDTDRMMSSRDELLAGLRGDREYDVKRDVYWAQYDAPFVLPFVRRNEAQVELTPRGQRQVAGGSPSHSAP